MSAADFRSLGLQPGASVDEARGAFKKLALKLHPDKNPSPDAHAKYIEKAKAYENILRAGDCAAEADVLLQDPLADLFGAGWARSLAEGTADPAAMLEQGRSRAAAELGGAEPMADLASQLGLDGATLSALMAEMNLRSAGAADEVDNPFKAFFDSLPDAERPQMMELFEKTFPAFLAQELADTQLEAENELFRHAVEHSTLPQQRSAPALAEDLVAAVEELNAEAVHCFGEARFDEAAAALTKAVALDPARPALYGNRSLAYEKAGRFEEALDDAERALACDAMYVAAYERKARALLGLGRAAEACAALRRGLLLEPEHEVLTELEREATEQAATAKLDIVRAGKAMQQSREADAGNVSAITWK